MVQKSKVYTRSGDRGETGLVGGQRVAKSDLRIDLYGDVDELNAHIGVVTTFMDEDTLFAQEREHLFEIQSLLFDLGSNLACIASQRSEFKLPQIPRDSIAKLEQEIDRMDAICPPLKTFILPSGAKGAAALHVCRTICRRVERKLITFTNNLGGDEAPLLGVEFLNRLSDYFFVLSRYINTLSRKKEILWIPRKG